MDEPDSLAQALKSLAHAKRLRLLRFLAEPHSLEECASDLGVARQSAQEHLDQLLALGLVEARRGRGGHGPVTHYVVSLPRLFDVYDQLGQRVGVVEREVDETIHLSLRTVPLQGGASAKAVPEGPRLTIVHGMRVMQTTLLQGSGPWMIGRDPHATLCLDYDSYVSARHAEVRRGSRGFELVDLYSSNGTFHEGERLTRGGIVPLAQGSIVRLGKTIVIFRAS